MPLVYCFEICGNRECLLGITKQLTFKYGKKVGLGHLMAYLNRLFLVVLQLQYQRSHILALISPLLQTLFSVAVELSCFIIHHLSSLACHFSFYQCLLFCFTSLIVHLFLVVVLKLRIAVSLGIRLIILHLLQVRHLLLPKSSEILLAADLLFTLLTFSFHLKLTAHMDLILHLRFACLLKFEPLSGFDFRFFNLFFKDLVLSILDSCQLLALSVDHLLSCGELIRESLFLSFLTHLRHGVSLFGILDCLLLEIFFLFNFCLTEML